MSQWTHVAGCIRFDGAKGITPPPDLGITWGYGLDYKEIGDEAHCNVPRGSEGSLQYVLIESSSGLPRFVATIWGDLRDFHVDDVQEIEDYLERITQGHMIRSGVVLIDWGSGAKLLQYECDPDDPVSGKWKE